MPKQRSGIETNILVICPVGATFAISFRKYKCLRKVLTIRHVQIIMYIGIDNDI